MLCSGPHQYRPAEYATSFGFGILATSCIWHFQMVDAPGPKGRQIIGGIVVFIILFTGFFAWYCSYFRLILRNCLRRRCRCNRLRELGSELSNSDSPPKSDRRSLSWCWKSVKNFVGRLRGSIFKRRNQQSREGEDQGNTGGLEDFEASNSENEVSVSKSGRRQQQGSSCISRTLSDCTTLSVGKDPHFPSSPSVEQAEERP